MIFYLFQEPIYLVSYSMECRPELDAGMNFIFSRLPRAERKKGFASFSISSVCSRPLLEDANEYARELEIIGHVHPVTVMKPIRVFQPIHDNVSNLFTDEVAYSLGTLIWQHGSPHYLSFPT